MCDVYDLGRTTGPCPKCGAVIELAEVDPELGTYEGSDRDWCPACGWQSDERVGYDPLTPWANVEDVAPL